MFESREKTWPSLLVNDTVLSSNTSRVMTEEPADEPVNTILGNVVLFLLVVILIFLSEFAIVLLLYYKIFL
jgi:uncharacterized membrane protein